MYNLFLLFVIISEVKGVPVYFYGGYGSSLPTSYSERIDLYGKSSSTTHLLTKPIIRPVLTKPFTPTAAVSYSYITHGLPHRYALGPIGYRPGHRYVYYGCRC